MSEEQRLNILVSLDCPNCLPKRYSSKWRGHYKLTTNARGLLVARCKRCSLRLQFRVTPLDEISTKTIRREYGLLVES